MNLRAGIYLVHCDQALFRVVRVHRGELLLEDCRHPDMPLQTLRAGELRDGKWRTVRPAKEAA